MHTIGLNEDGIFRVNPNKVEVDDLKQKFENGNGQIQLIKTQQKKKQTKN